MTGKVWTAIVICMFILCAMPLFAPAATITPDLTRALRGAGTGSVDLIINLADRVDPSKLPAATAGISRADRAYARAALVTALKDKADATQGRLRTLLRTRGAKRVLPLWISNSIAASVPADVIPELAGLPEVESIQADTAIQASPLVPAAATVPLWNISRINAPALWNAGITGTGVVVANLDTGVDVTHPDLAPKWRGGACASPPDCDSWYDPHTNSTSPYDQAASHTGHGTGTMGIMVGASATDAYGVAPGAQWIAAKIFNDSGVASASVIISALQWVLMPGGNASNAPDVVNNSWGYDTAGCSYEPALDKAIQNVMTAGIAVVFSAGNLGPASPSSVSPANYPGVFSVGATDSTDLIASFSSRGPSDCGGATFPNVVAPGVGIYTAGTAGTYASFSGTSFAAPHVAGAMALLAGALPTLAPADLAAVLEQTAVPLPVAGTVPNNDYGYGLIDLTTAYTDRFIALNGDVAHIAAVPAAGTFADRPIGEVSPSQVFIVANQGTVSLSIDAPPGGVTLTGLNAADFIITSDACSGAALPSLGSCLVGVSFSPATIGPKSASLVISSSDSLTPNLYIPLGGSGVAAYNIALVRSGATIGTYPTIQAAYADAAHGDTIKARATTINENPDLNSTSDIAVTILGGYASGFGVRTGTTAMEGSLTVSRGSLTISDVAVK